MLLGDNLGPMNGPECIKYHSLLLIIVFFMITVTLKDEKVEKKNVFDIIDTVGNTSNKGHIRHNSSRCIK